MYRIRGLNKWIAVPLLILMSLFLLVLIAAHFMQEPLRRKMQAEINNRLKGYTVRVGGLDLHPLSFSVDLQDLYIYQNANPKPPVAYIHALKAGVHWRALLHGHLVADMAVDNPKLYINLKQLETQVKSEVPVRKEGWQDAVQAIYPLKINVFSVHNGSFTYVDKGPFKPLQLTNISLTAEDIRNVINPRQPLPSTLNMKARVFEKGEMAAVGRANFLGKPEPAIKAGFDVRNMDLSYFKPIVERGNLDVQGGVVSAKGDMEYSSQAERFHVQQLVIDGMQLFYIHSPETETREKEHAREAKAKAKEAVKTPKTLFIIDNLEIKNSTLGFANKSTDPQYRVFISNTFFDIKNFSNKFKQGPATVRLSGKFMGSGDTSLDGAFRPETSGPDFHLKLAIQNTQLTTMNDLLAAYGKFEVDAGLFSFYSEITVKNDYLRGYVKPLFKDIKVHEHKKAGLLRKAYEKLVGGLAKVFENPKRTVATAAEIGGPLNSPHASTWEILVNILRNAFFRSILPGFGRETGQKE